MSWFSLISFYPLFLFLFLSQPLSIFLPLSLSLSLSLTLFLSLSLALALIPSPYHYISIHCVDRSMIIYLLVVRLLIAVYGLIIDHPLPVYVLKPRRIFSPTFFCMTDLADLLHALGMYNHDSQEISISMNNRLLLSMSAGLTLLMANILLVHLLYFHIIWKEFCRLTLVMGFRNSLLSFIPLFLSLALSQFLSISLSLSLSLCLALALSLIYLSPLFLLSLFFHSYSIIRIPLYFALSLSLLLSLFYSRLISYYIALDFIL